MKKLVLITACVLIFVGVVSLINIYFELHLWRIIFPVLLIVLGGWLVFSPTARDKFSFSRFRILGDVDVRSPDERVLMGIGDVKIDLDAIPLTPGVKEMKVTGLITDVKVRSSGKAGIWILSNSLLTDANVLGENETDILYPFEYISEGYDGAEKKVKLQVESLICEMKVKSNS